MLRSKLIILLFYMSISGLFAQKFGAVPIEMDKRFIYARVSWISENTFCIVADKGYNEGKFTHFVFHYDSTGTNIRHPLKFQSTYSSQSNFCFSLGRTVFYLEDENSDMGGDIFRIADYVDPDGNLHNERKEIFFISHAKQFRKLENDNPVFESIVGLNKQKALLTYNNDFVDPFFESIQFRILDENGNMTLVDTLKLPYIDRLCNIIDVVFDDEKMDLFILCNLLEDLGDKRRKFVKSIFIRYNIASKVMTEIKNDLPVFSKCKMQHVMKGGKIYFSGLKTDETDPSKWSVAFAEIDLLNMKVELAKNINPIPEYTNGFYSKGKLYSHSIFPIAFNVDNKGNYSAGWIKFYSLEQIPAMNNIPGQNVGIPIIVAPSIGILGMALLAGAALAINSANNYSVKSNPGIWFNYSPGMEQFAVNTMKSSANWGNYYTYDMANIEVEQSSYCLYNSNSEVDKALSVVKAEKIGFNTDTIHKSLTDIFPDFPVNILFPGSGYQTSDRSYFIGQYSSINDPNAKAETYKRDQLYLIIFE